MSKSVVNLIVKRGCEDSPFTYIIRQSSAERTTYDPSEAVRLLAKLGVGEPERRLEQARQWGRVNIAVGHRQGAAVSN